MSLRTEQTPATLGVDLDEEADRGFFSLKRLFEEALCCSGGRLLVYVSGLRF